jgi:hypothetical protein
MPEPTEASAPKDEYASRLVQRREGRDRCHRRYQWYANARLAVFLAGCFLAWFVFGPHRISAAWLGCPAAVFILLLFRHAAVRQALRAAQRGVGFYEGGLARLEDRWPGMGQAGTRFLDDHHSYALDLDLFGKGSLFELFCNARTRTGADTLAAWLLVAATPETVRGRQAAAIELRSKLDWRESMAIVGPDVPEETDVEKLIRWGAAPPVRFPSWARAAMVMLPMLALLAAIGWLSLDRIGVGPLLLVVLGEMAVSWRLRPAIQQVLGPVEKRARDLALFSALLRCIERENFKSEMLRCLQNSLFANGQSSSLAIAGLERLVDWLNSRRNMLFAPFAFVLLWHLRYAFQIESWRQTAGPALGRWLAVLGEIEALITLANHSYENPADTYPEICESEACFEGEGLGHPLLPRSVCVRNDVRLDEWRVLMVSGSNMSGKSTLLRTVGINTVLALAGAPVRAHKLRLSRLAIGATLRIQDSLQEGRSRFYAEVLRVRQLVAMAQKQPSLLFLLDELFQGTNSHDRRLGAEAVIRGLIEHGAIGLVTTHDLALTQIVDRLGLRAANVHFQDRFENGTMTFDYRMRPGVVEHSNALALMRAVGIDV